MSRSIEEIKQEYSNILLKAGSLQYEVLCKENDLKLVNNRLQELNLEFVSASNTAAEVAKKLAEAKKDEEVNKKPTETEAPALALVPEAKQE